MEVVEWGLSINDWGLIVIMRIAHLEEKQAISIRTNFWVQLNGQFCMMQNFVVHVLVAVTPKLSLYAKLPPATK